MIKGIKLRKIFIFVIYVAVFMYTAICADASENMILGINVKQNAQGIYNVILKTDKKPDINKYEDKDGNLVLVLNKTIPSESMEIVYDNASDINNVIVQKKNSNNTVILIQGKNVYASEIYNKELLTGNTIQYNFNAQNKGKFPYIVIGMIVLAGIITKRLRRKKCEEIMRNKINSVKSVKMQGINTLRYKNLHQSANIPSINYNINGSFNSINYATSPQEFVKSNNSYENEEIRKVG